MGALRRLLPLLAALLAAFWLLARPPSRYALEESVRGFQEERRRSYRLLSLAIGDLEALLLTGRHPEAQSRLDALRAEREEGLGKEKSVAVRGWRLRIVPAAAPRAPGGPAPLFSLDPSAPGDAPPLRGPMELHLERQGGLARYWPLSP